MVRARELAQQMGLQKRTATTRIVGSLDVRRVNHVHQKLAPGRRTFDRLAETAVKLYEEMVT